MEFTNLSTNLYSGRYQTSNGSPSPIGKGDEEDRLDRVAASRNAKLDTDRSIVTRPQNPSNRVKEVFSKECIEGSGLRLAETKANKTNFYRYEAATRTWHDAEENTVKLGEKGLCVADGEDPHIVLREEVKKIREKQLKDSKLTRTIVGMEIGELIQRKKDTQLSLYLMASILKPSEKELKNEGIKQLDYDKRMKDIRWTMLHWNQGITNYDSWLQENGSQLKKILFEKNPKLYQDYLENTLNMLTLTTDVVDGYQKHHNPKLQLPAATGTLLEQARAEKKYFKKKESEWIWMANGMNSTTSCEIRKKLIANVGKNSFAFSQYFDQRKIQKMKQYLEKTGQKDNPVFNTTRHFFNHSEIVQDLTRDSMGLQQICKKLPEGKLKEVMRKAEAQVKSSVNSFNEQKRAQDFLDAIHFIQKYGSKAHKKNDATRHFASLISAANIFAQSIDLFSTRELQDVGHFIASISSIAPLSDENKKSVQGIIEIINLQLDVYSMKLELYQEKDKAMKKEFKEFKELENINKEIRDLDAKINRVELENVKRELKTIDKQMVALDSKKKPAWHVRLSIPFTSSASINYC